MLQAPRTGEFTHATESEWLPPLMLSRLANSSLSWLAKSTSHEASHSSQTNHEAIIACDGESRLQNRTRRSLKPIRIRQSQYLNNRIEQDHIGVSSDGYVPCSDSNQPPAP